MEKTPLEEQVRIMTENETNKIDKIKKDMIVAFSTAKEIYKEKAVYGVNGNAFDDGTRVAIAIMAVKIFDEMRK